MLVIERIRRSTKSPITEKVHLLTLSLITLEHGDNHGGFKKPYRKKEHTGNDSQQAQPDPDDKYFKNRNVDGSEPFKIKFTRGSEKLT